MNRTRRARHAWRHFLPYIRKHRRALSWSLAGVALFTVLSVIPPLLMRYLVDEVIEPEAWHLLAWVAVAILVVPLAAQMTRVASVWALSIASRRFLHDLRLALYRKVLALNMRFHAENSSGSLAGRIIDDVSMMHLVISQNTLQVIVDAVVFSLAFAIAATISARLTIMLAVTLSFYVFVYRYFSRKIRVAAASYRSLYDEITGRMQETITGVRQVRIYNRENWETGRFLERTGRGLDRALDARIGSIGLSTGCSAVQQIASSLIVFSGAWMVLHQDLSYGDLLAFSAYMGFVFQPAVGLLDVAGQMEETMVSAGRIAEILTEDPLIHEKPGARDKPRGSGLIEFDGVHFGYAPDQRLYCGLNLRIEPGASVAIVGPTGCGKTTLTALLMRYWDVQGGAIRIDGVDIRDLRLKSLRRHFGIVLQEPVVFAGTFAENIAYGIPRASRESIERAARTAEIHDTIVSHPDGYDTVLGPSGIQPSRGEKQRISIARAVLRDPEILIMDEATSALDSESEALIQKALTRVLAGRTSLVIAHRLSTIMGCDRIVVMRDGAVVESGAHADLLARRDGLYHQLYEQLRGEEAGPTP